MIVELFEIQFLVHFTQSGDEKDAGLEGLHSVSLLKHRVNPQIYTCRTR